MAHEFAVAQHEANPLAAQQVEADLAHGNALGGVGMAAAVVGQFPLQRHVPVALADGDKQDIDGALAHAPLGGVEAQTQVAGGRQEADQQTSQHEVVQVHVPEKVLNPVLVRGRFRGIVQVLGHFAEPHVAALYQPDEELGDEFLPRQVPHQGDALQNGRHFDDEALLRGAERLLGVGTTKAGPPRFNAASFARPNTSQRNVFNSKLLVKKPKEQRTELQTKCFTVRQLKNHGVEWTSCYRLQLKADVM